MSALFKNFHIIKLACALALATPAAAGSRAGTQALPEAPFRKVTADQIPLTDLEGDLPLLRQALRRQLEACGRQDPSRAIRLGDRIVRAEQWCTATSREFLRLADASGTWTEFMSRALPRFDWYQTTGRDGKGEVLFTGYHSPTLEAVLPSEREPGFNVPLYRQPTDLVRIIEGGRKVWRKRNADGTTSPYWDREAISSHGALNGQGAELAYVRDWWDAYVMQMEGAGTLVLRRPDGSTERRFINYAAQNGRPWVSITQYLREQGLPPESLSMPGIRKYLRDHPDRLMPTLNQDPSYVFFQFDQAGPYGVNQIILTPRHSVAADLGIFPEGAVTLFDTERPVMSGDDVTAWKHFRSVAVVQDKGGAIKGPGRIDVFWGDDAYADQAAGRMHHLGTVYMAILKESIRP